RDLRLLEIEAASAQSPAARQRVADGLREVEDKVREIGVPLAFHDDLYRLRTHIAFVRSQLELD
ncbi:MAG: C4-dicarboxylate ABC transporter substrate-binding protein, partial [Pseudomonadota bacterium]